jgi:hypothetical protein
MLRYAGVGVAMGNAAQPVMECADWVTASISEGGVAKAVEEWILNDRVSSTTTSVYSSWPASDLSADLVTAS